MKNIKNKLSNILKFTFLILAFSTLSNKNVLIPRMMRIKTVNYNTMAKNRNNNYNYDTAAMNRYINNPNTMVMNINTKNKKTRDEYDGDEKSYWYLVATGKNVSGEEVPNDFDWEKFKLNYEINRLSFIKKELKNKNNNRKKLENKNNILTYNFNLKNKKNKPLNLKTNDISNNIRIRKPAPNSFIYLKKVPFMLPFVYNNNNTLSLTNNNTLSSLNESSFLNTSCLTNNTYVRKHIQNFSTLSDITKGTTSENFLSLEYMEKDINNFLDNCNIARDKKLKEEKIKKEKEEKIKKELEEERLKTNKKRVTKSRYDNNLILESNIGLSYETKTNEKLDDVRKKELEEKERNEKLKEEKIKKEKEEKIKKELEEKRKKELEEKIKVLIDKDYDLKISRAIENKEEFLKKYKKSIRGSRLYIKFYANENLNKKSNEELKRLEKSIKDLKNYKAVVEKIKEKNITNKSSNYLNYLNILEQLEEKIENIEKNDDLEAKDLEAKDLEAKQIIDEDFLKRSKSNQEKIIKLNNLINLINDNRIIKPEEYETLLNYARDFTKFKNNYRIFYDTLKEKTKKEKTKKEKTKTDSSYEFKEYEFKDLLAKKLKVENRILYNLIYVLEDYKKEKNKRRFSKKDLESIYSKLDICKKLYNQEDLKKFED